MNNHNTTSSTRPLLLQNLLNLLEVHRPAFRQERPFVRAMALVFGDLLAFSRHTVTQSLLALGLVDADWSAWHRLFSRPRFDEERLNACLLGQTLAEVPPEQPYVVGVDCTQVPRSSRRLPGSGWLRAPRTAPFRSGLHRAQRFLHGSWLTPLKEGFSRAIPLRFLPAFTPKAQPALAPASREWEAGLSFIGWVREQLDRAERAAQLLVVVADGAYDRTGFWLGLPARAVALVRTARNRVLFHLPEPHAGRGRPRDYGERALSPNECLREKGSWQKVRILVRGRERQLRVRVRGPFVREGASSVPIFLIVVGGASYSVGKHKPHKKQRKPAYYLVSAVEQAGSWQLPLPLTSLLEWAWQRWELEVAHREMKSGMGVGEKQCWGKRSAILSVQWSVWVYALFLLAGYHTWGLLGGPKAPARWWKGARRWSLSTLWRAYRAALWGDTQFQAVCTGSPDNWLKKEPLLAGLRNAALLSTRI